MLTSGTGSPELSVLHALLEVPRTLGQVSL